MSYYRTIKELVVETCIAEGGFPSYEKLTSLVKQHFPNSKWQSTHYAWYKSKIKTGEIQVSGISTEKSEESYGDEIESEVDESNEARVSLERDLHSYLATRVGEIESGLSLVENGVEYQTEAGRIDLLARDASKQLVVIEKPRIVRWDSYWDIWVVSRILNPICEGYWWHPVLIRESFMRREGYHL